jgi:hypothetical protein
MPTITEAEWRAALDRAGDAEQRAAELAAEVLALRASKCTVADSNAVAARYIRERDEAAEEAEQLRARLAEAERERDDLARRLLDAEAAGRARDAFAAEVERLKAELAEAHTDDVVSLAVDAAEARGAQWAIDAARKRLGALKVDGFCVGEIARAHLAEMGTGEMIVRAAHERQPMASEAPQVGDRVRVVRCCPEGNERVCCDAYEGMVGVIKTIESDCDQQMPYLVHEEDGDRRWAWFHAVERVDAEPRCASTATGGERCELAAAHEGGHRGGAVEWREGVDRPVTVAMLVAALRDAPMPQLPRKWFAAVAELLEARR